MSDAPPSPRQDRVASGLDGDDGGEWDAARPQLVAKYEEAGLHEIARFIRAAGEA